MSTKPKDDTDIVAGLFFMALAAFFGWQALGLEMGTSIRMGPGYFPIVLSGLLFLLGAVILFKA
ncbi:tripartite tricarboxylate transporter TctB family protein, partial [Paracoccus benzoatiresistens]